jgi:type IV pilus assembly protein PilB
MQSHKRSDLFKAIKELEVIPEDKLEDAYKQSKQKDKTLEEVLVDKDLIADSDLSKIIADLYKLQTINLSQTSIDKDVLSEIPEVVAREQRIIAFKKDGEGLHLAMADPSNEQIRQFIEKKFGIPVSVYYSSNREIDDALTLYQHDIKKAFSEIISENIEKAKGAQKPEPSIIKIVETIITYAYQNKASDIHIEPDDEKSTVRFRIDGILHDIIELPVGLHNQIVTRVKVLAQLRTDEHSKPQDGKIVQKMKHEDLDMRVSVVPVTDGEKIVMRLLSERSRQFSLKDLGFSESDLKKVEEAYNKPHGLVLATGPTGSGKTTTLYAILKLLNKRVVNIMTIEDPVEYDIEGVNQIQVNTKTGLTFAKGLRSIVRQDPDIILVGEIRDEETADISINAAMTGHLVLSTLHTNDAATSIPRLIDMKIEPFLVGSTVIVIVAQRLVRKICSSCRVSKELDLNKYQGRTKSTETLQLYQKYFAKYFGQGKEKVRVYEGKGCPVCHKTGYVGRIGIFEVLEVDEKIRKAIVETKDSGAIRDIATDAGMTTMVENGFQKVKSGETTIEEVLRVIKE